MSNLPEFYGAVAITDAEAPQHIIESERHASSYYATVSRRLGAISCDNFFELGHRYVALCDTVYQGSDVTLTIDRCVPVKDELFHGRATFEDYDGYRKQPGRPVDITQLTKNSFSDIFRSASTVSLRTRPRNPTSEQRSSFADVEWTAELPKVLSFYAQDGGNYDLPASDRPLQNLLTRKMFFVPGSAPTPNLKVNLGISASMDAKRGKTRTNLSLPRNLDYTSRSMQIE